MSSIYIRFKGSYFAVVTLGEQITNDCLLNVTMSYLHSDPREESATDERQVS